MPTVPDGGCDPLVVTGHSRVPLGVKLAKEQLAPLLLRSFADGSRRRAKSVEGAQEAPVGLVAPAHVPRTPPSGAAQGVQTPVITNAGVSVRFDVVAGGPGQPGPAIEIGGVGGHDRGQGLPLVAGRQLPGPVQGGDGVRRRSGEDGLGWPGGEGD
jgi:hypothetical protein